MLQAARSANQLYSTAVIENRWNYNTQTAQKSSSPLDNAIFVGQNNH